MGGSGYTISRILNESSGEGEGASRVEGGIGARGRRSSKYSVSQLAKWYDNINDDRARVIHIFRRRRHGGSESRKSIDPAYDSFALITRVDEIESQPRREITFDDPFISPFIYPSKPSNRVARGTQLIQRFAYLTLVVGYSPQATFVRNYWKLPNEWNR